MSNPTEPEETDPELGSDALLGAVPTVHTCNDIDYELAKLLGEKVFGFVQLVADGEVVPFMGTPPDSESGRRMMLELVHDLNDGGEWPKFFEDWKSKFCKWRKFPDCTTPLDYKPVFSAQVSLTVCGYSQNDHTAVGLLDRLDLLLWQITRREQHVLVSVMRKNGESERFEGDQIGATAARAAKWILAPNSQDRASA